MAIDTEEEYDPRLDHPLYTKIIPPEHNDYELWEEYQIRIPDEEKGEEGPYNYAFDAILVGKEIATWEEIPNLLKAYTAKERDAQTAMMKIHPGADADYFNPDDELAVLFFLREDQTKEFITMEVDSLLAQEGDVEHKNEHNS